MTGNHLTDPKTTADVRTSAAPNWLTRPRAWMFGGIVAVGAGLALNWSWLTAVGVAPILLSVLPCAAMCALGLCMRGDAGKSCSKDGGTGPHDSAMDKHQRD